jgi:hypothetical protein
MSDERREIDSGHRWKNSQIYFRQTKGRVLVSNDGIAERRQFAAATESVAFDQRDRRNVFRSQFLKSRTIITNGAQHLDFTAIEVVLDIDSSAESSFTGASNHNQPRGILHRIPQRCRQLIDHFNAENIKRWPIKD